MNNTTLKHTKVRLTVIFTLLVLAMAILLEVVFFSIKYYNNIFVEKNQFNKQTVTVQERFSNVDDIIKNFDIWKRVFSMWDNHLNHARRQAANLNLIIIEKNKWKLVFSNVVENLKLEFVKEEFLENDYGKVEQDDWYFVRKINLKDSKWNYDILFIKKLNYPFAHYLTDLAGFILITLLFSTVFYFVWFKFVSKNLKPVEDSLADMQDFIHNAWHELKTPIAIINSNLQLIKETKEFDKDLVREWLTEINRLDHLIESLVELSNINSSEYIEKLDLKDEIKEIVKDFKNEADKKEVKIRFTKVDDKIVLMNKQYFYILFSNILWNAIRYNKDWWKVHITLDKNKISIKDTWSWIKKEDLEKIFDRFFMSTNSRNNEWHGIWLSLVKKIANIYKMKISMKSEEGKWSEFVIEF